MAGPLAGVTVVDLTTVVMGPYATQILGDLGATVIKVEAPGGDNVRHVGPMRNPGMGHMFMHLNRNKKSVVLDIQTPEGLASARELIGASDVLIENFRPGLMERLGLGHEALSRDFPRLITVSHKGFLPGPYENRLALDEVVQNMAGLTYMTGPPGRPLRAGSSVTDIMGGVFGAIGVLAALRERERTGRGQAIQSALFENCCLLAAQHMQQFQMTGEVPPPFPARVSAWSVYDTFEVAGGDQLFIGAVSDKQFLALCGVLGRGDLAGDPDLATNTQRVARRPALLAELGRTLRAHAIDALCERLQAAGLPYARVVRPDQLVADEHLLQSGGLVPMVTDDGDTTQVVLLPLLMGGRRPGVRHPLAAVGEHTEEVLGRRTPSPRASPNASPQSA